MSAGFDGGCNCGAVRYRIDGAPIAVAACHCTRCRRQSGSAFSVNLIVKAGAMQMMGEVRVFSDRETESGAPVQREFCGDCGSPIRSRPTGQSKTIAVKAGTADDPGGFAPTLHIWTSSALPWVTIPSDLPSFPRGATR